MILWMIAAATATAPEMVGRAPALDVPPALARRTVAGRETLHVTVSDAGVPVACRAELGDGAAYQDRDNCRALLKERYQPARDDQGAALYGTTSMVLTWRVTRPDVGGKVVDVPTLALGASDSVYLVVNRLPAGMIGLAAAAVRITVAADGRVEGCSVARPSGNAGLDRLACSSPAVLARATALKGSDGATHRSLRSLEVQFLPPDRARALAPS